MTFVQAARAAKQLVKRFPLLRRHPLQSQLILGVVTDAQGRSYYAGRQDVYPDAEAFDRLFGAAGSTPVTIAWCQYHPYSSTDPLGTLQIHFQPQRRSFPVWCRQIQNESIQVKEDAHGNQSLVY